jgi:hypothetical protein
MPKHNSKEPKFRCNFCKEYHYVPEYKTMYQCASHGYLCEKVIVTKDSKVNLLCYDNDEFLKSSISIPEKYIGFCNLDGNTSFTTIRYKINFFERELKANGLTLNPSDEEIIDLHWNKFSTLNRNQPATYGCKKTIKYNWSDELNLWIEEGYENASLDKKPTQSFKNSNSNTEIKLLLDLYEKNILTKEQFVAQLKEKL